MSSLLEVDRARRRASRARRPCRPIVVLPQPDSPTSPKVSPCADGERDVGDRLDRPDLASGRRRPRSRGTPSRGGRRGRATGAVASASVRASWRASATSSTLTLRSAAFATASGRFAIVSGSTSTWWKQATRCSGRVGGGVERRLALAAVVLGVAAAGGEAAVRDRLGEVRRQPRDADEADGGVLVELRDRRQERLGVGVAHVGEELGRWWRSRRCWPAYMTSTRSARSAITPMSWVMRITAIRSSLAEVGRAGRGSGPGS